MLTLLSNSKAEKRAKLLLAFEYGVTLAQVAQEHKHELTHELMEKAEKMLENEFKIHDATYLAQPANMVSNILSVFELSLTDA